VTAHFREASRVARRAVLLCDMHRNALVLAGLWTFVLFAGGGPEFRGDAVLSVRRGWRTQEWRRLAQAAGLWDARVWREHGSRVLLALKKDGRAELSAPEN
jgi:hypothetical protein